MHRSWLSAKHDFPKFHTHLEGRNLASLKGCECCIHTSCELSTLGPSIQQLLEAHVIKVRVRHTWGQPLQAFEFIHLKLSEAQHLPLPLSPFPSSATCVSGAHSKVKLTNLLGKSQPLLRKKGITKESFPTSASPLPAPSPACEEAQKAMGRTPPDYDRGPSQARLTEREGRLPSQSLILGLRDRTQQTGTVVGVEKRSLEPSPSSVVAKNEPREERKGQAQASGHPCHRVAILEINLGSHSSRAEETREAVEAREASAWEAIREPCVLAPTINIHVRTSGSLGPRKSSSPPTKSAAQDQEQPYLKTKYASKFELRGKAEANNQPQGHATGVLLQDYATCMFLQDTHTNVPLAVDILASHRSLSSSQREHTSGDMTVPLVPYDLILNGHSSQRQQEPRIPKVKEPYKSQSKMFVPTGEREGNRRPNPGQQDEGLAGLRTPQASEMSHSPQVRGIGDTLGSKCFQLLSEKKEVFSENHFRKKKTHFPQYLNSNQKDKGPEHVLPKGQPASAIVQSCDPGRSPLVMDDRPVETQSIVTALGQLLVEQLWFRQGLHASDLNQNIKQFQAPVGGYSCYHRPLFSPENRKVISEMTYDYQATSKGHNYPNNSGWTRDQTASGPSHPGN